MEWMLNINDMLQDDITKITNSLIPPGFKGDTGSIRRMQDSLSRVVDQIGELSAAEQGLSKVITTAEKLRTANDHTLYLLKDAEANRGAGEVVGMLKVGRKHLFLFDEAQTVREVEPLCVLDFFVKRSHQRRGLGRRLFDHMLQEQQTAVHRLAVDGPSENMQAFLTKNYNIHRLIRQNNNFAVSPAFFDEHANSISAVGRSPADGGAAAGAFAGSGAAAGGGGGGGGGGVGRYTAHKPQSSMANVIHGGGEPRAPGLACQDGEKYQQRASAAPTPAPSPSPRAGAGAGEPPQRRPRSLAVAPPTPAPAAAAPAVPATPAGAPSRRDSELTDKGFFDVKFHHKKLW